MAKTLEKAFVFKRLHDARIHEGCRIRLQCGWLRTPDLRDQCFHAIHCGVRRVRKRSSQISVRVVEGGEISFRIFLQNSDGGSFLSFDEMDPFNCSATETEHRVRLFAEHTLAGDHAAVRIRNAFAGEIRQNLKSQLFRELSLGIADDRELSLPLLHGDNAQIGGADDTQT